MTRDKSGLPARRCKTFACSEHIRLPKPAARIMTPSGSISYPQRSRTSSTTISAFTRNSEIYPYEEREIDTSGRKAGRLALKPRQDESFVNRVRVSVAPLGQFFICQISEVVPLQEIISCSRHS